MNAAILVDVLLALLPIVIGTITYLGAQKAIHSQAQTAEAEVDAKAYDRAKSIYESAIKALEDQINRLREQTNLLDGEVSRLQKSNLTLRSQVEELQQANRHLERELRQFKKETSNGNA